MTQTIALGADELRATMVTYRDALRAHQELLNRLNVYPVPDGDTGTNMALTLDSVVRELEHAERGGGAAEPGEPAPGEPSAMAAVCRAVAHGSLMGARGNSGVILSQLLRGLTERWLGCDRVGTDSFAEALVRASDLAHKAVVRPVEGTILTVARAAGEGATAAKGAGESLVRAVERARGAAGQALSDTPNLLEPLRRAGVVDAGGAGYVLLLDSLLTVIDGRPQPAAPPEATAMPAAQSTPTHDKGGGPDGHRPDRRPGHDGGALIADHLRYEVMYLLDAPDETIGAFRRAWAAVGDSIVVVGGDGLWNCHIHTNDVGAAIEAAIDIGRPYQIRVTDLAEQVEEERWVSEAASAGAGSSAHGAGERNETSGPTPVTGVVAVVVGEGIGRILRSLGAQRLVPGGQSMNPSTAELLEAVEGVDASEVVILPNNENVEPVAKQVDALTAKTVRVVPTGSIVEGFAALLAYDPGADVDSNVTAMTASAQRVVPGAITRAVRDADTDIGSVRQGDWIGISREGIVSVGDSAAEAALRLLDAVVGDEHELVTVIEGEEATPATTRRITEWVRAEHPRVSVEVHHGGQPLYPYLLGIE